MKPIKILLVTDSAQIHTGLGENCRLVFKDLVARFPGKYEIHQLGWFHINPTEQVPWTVHATNFIKQPNGSMDIDVNDKYGQRSFEAILAQVKPDIVWSSGDLWCFDHLLNSPNRNNFRLALYYTIDGSPYFGSWLKPNDSSEWGQRLKKTDSLIVWSEFGKEVLKESCPELKNKEIDVIYHPSDTNRFKALDRPAKVELRKKLYKDQINQDAFILGFIGRNQFRKQNHRMWEVLGYAINGHYIECKTCNRVTVKEFNWCTQTARVGNTYRYEAGYNYDHCWYCKSKDIVSGTPLKDLMLWQHTPMTDPGYNINLHLTMYNIANNVIRTSMTGPSHGFSPQQMADMISSWDGMLYISGGEGFGIPAFECQAAGLPIIYSNYSSHADFAKHGGLPVRCEFIPEFVFGIHRAMVDPGDCVKQLLWAYRNREEFAALGLKGQAFSKTKSIANVGDQWDSLFTRMMKEKVGAHGAKRVYGTSV